MFSKIPVCILGIANCFLDLFVYQQEKLLTGILAEPTYREGLRTSGGEGERGSGTVLE